MAKLVDQLLPAPEIRGLNPDMGKVLFTKLSTNLIIEKTKIKKKRPGMAQLFKNDLVF